MHIFILIAIGPNAYTGVRMSKQQLESGVRNMHYGLLYQSVV